MSNGKYANMGIRRTYKPTPPPKPNPTPTTHNAIAYDQHPPPTYSNGNILQTKCRRETKLIQIRLPESRDPRPHTKRHQMPNIIHKLTTATHDPTTPPTRKSTEHKKQTRLPEKCSAAHLPHKLIYNKARQTRTPATSYTTYQSQSQNR